MLIFKKVSSDVIKCHQMSGKAVLRWEGNAGEQGKAGQKEICDKKREAVCTAGKGGGGTNDAEPCRAEGAEAPCLLMVPCIFTKGFL